MTPLYIAKMYYLKQKIRLIYTYYVDTMNMHLANVFHGKFHGQRFSIWVQVKSLSNRIAKMKGIFIA